MPVEQTHLTLRWIGAVSLRQSTVQNIRLLAETLPLPRWTAISLQPFPKAKPSLLAAWLVGDATAVAFVRQLDELLLADQVPERTQPFLPHVTLLRSRANTTVTPLNCSLVADRLSLVQSTLTSFGPQYTVEQVFSFHG